MFMNSVDDYFSLRFSSFEGLEGGASYARMHQGNTSEQVIFPMFMNSVDDYFSLRFSSFEGLEGGASYARMHQGNTSEQGGTRL